MIIKELRMYYVVMRLKEPFTTSFGTERFRHTLIIRLVDDKGMNGWGEVVADSGPWYSYETVKTAWHIIRDYIAPQILGKDIDLRTFRDVAGKIRGHNMAKAGVEFALWDLMAKRKGMPLYKLLGGVRDKVPIGISIGIKRNVNELLKHISKALDKGYLRIKIKIKPGWDVNIVKKVREEFGDIPLQVDANSAYTLNDLPILKELDKYDLLMIEQPLHYDDLVEHAELQRLLKTPICLDESIKGLRDTIAAYKLGSCSIINVKPGRVGGLLETLEIHEFTRKVGIPIWIGGLIETGIGRSFAIATATLLNVRYPNDISPSSRFWVKDLVEPPWELKSDGTIEVPKKPGIGVEVLEDVLVRYRRKELRLRP